MSKVIEMYRRANGVYGVARGAIARSISPIWSRLGRGGVRLGLYNDIPGVPNRDLPRYLQCLDPDYAMGLSAIYAAITMISEDIAGLPLKVKQIQANGDKVVVESHPVAQLMKYTWDGGESNSFYSKRQAVNYCLGWGQCIHEIVYDGPDVASLVQHHPQHARAERDPKTGRKFYRFTGQPNGDVDLVPSKVLHFMNSSLDGLNGASPVELMGRSVGSLLAMESYALNTFLSGANQRGFITSDQEYNPAKAKEIVDHVMKGNTGPENANKLGVLMGGLKFISTAFSPEAAQLIASRTFGIQEVGRMFHISPTLLGDLSKGTMANVEELNQQYLFRTLMRWCEMIEAECNLKLFTRQERLAGFCVEHDTSSLLRANTLARTQRAVSLVASGIWSINEARRDDGMAGIGPDGDKHLVQLNQTTVEKIDEPAKEEAPAGPTAEPDADPASEQDETTDETETPVE